jgi:hypothetical protein
VKVTRFPNLEAGFAVIRIGALPQVSHRVEFVEVPSSSSSVLPLVVRMVVRFRGARRT